MTRLVMPWSVMRASPAPVVAGAALVGGVVRERAAVGHLGQDDHGRAAQQRLEEALPGVAGDPLALAHDHQRPAGEAAIGLGHGGAEGLLAHLHHPDGVVGVQGGEQIAGVAARDPEHVLDPGLGQHADDGVGDVDRLREVRRPRSFVIRHWTPPLTCGYSAIWPASTARADPVMNGARSLAQNSTTRAMPSGTPGRPKGSCEYTSVECMSAVRACAATASVPGVTTMVGAIASARMPCGPSSTARLRVRPRRPCFELE